MNCPFCNANQDREFDSEDTRFPDCGTLVDIKNPQWTKRSNQCFEGEIENLKDRIRKLLEKVKKMKGTN